MKTQLLGLFLLGFANLNHAQVSVVKLADVVISPLNISYLTAVKDANTPEIAQQLELQASQFDITESPVFDEQYDTYEVVFQEKNSKRSTIVATYDNDGRILNSYEKFNYVSVPPAVRNAVYNKFPNWKISSDTYLVTYYSGKKANRVFKLKIKKDNKKKTLKVDVNGNFI